jgi:GSH-dependent disulfide-bond oxidoreductase
MIELYTAPTPNGRKVSIMLEEIGLPYLAHLIDLGAGDQHQTDFLKLNLNNKIPVIYDPDTGVTLAESGAILSYLAEKTGRFQPKDLRARYETLQWLMFQMASVGPMLGQLGHFRHTAEPVPAALRRYEKEAKRILAVLDRRLADRGFLVGDYGIADIATWPWINAAGALGLSLSDYPNLRRWHGAIKTRPAVKRAMAVPSGDAARPFALPAVA